MTQEISRYARYYQDHKEQCLAASKAWRLANPEKVREIKRNYRDRKAEREGRVIKPRRPRRKLTRILSIQNTGLTKMGEMLIRKIASGSPAFSREGFDVRVLGGERVFDRDGVQIQFEEDEDLNLENEVVGAGRRGLKAQHAEDSRDYYHNHRKAEIERSKLFRRAHPEVGRKYRENSITTLKYNIGSRRRLLRERRVRVITHYGDGKMACVLCGEAKGSRLTIDYSGPGQDRATRYSGDELYRRLEAQGFPDGYRTICLKCQRRIRMEISKKMKASRRGVLSK